MPHFTTAPVEDVMPARRQRQPSQRAQIQKQYENALKSAVFDKHEALVIELEPEDKPLTVRSRIKRAAGSLGLDNIVVRRRRNKIMAYLPPGADSSL